jgi:hypothetical protein
MTGKTKLFLLRYTYQEPQVFDYCQATPDMTQWDTWLMDEATRRARRRLMRKEGGTLRHIFFFLAQNESRMNLVLHDLSYYLFMENELRKMNALAFINLEVTVTYFGFQYFLR